MLGFSIYVDRFAKSDIGVSKIMIRVLQILSRLSLNTGVMGFLLNYYRHIDKSKVQFDFLYFLDKDQEIYDEIVGCGGRVFHIDKPSLSVGSIKNIKAFFSNHKNEYPIVHNHEVYLTFAFAPMAKKYGTKAFISHSHTTVLSANPLNRVRNHILCLPVNRLSDYRFACSNEAGIALFGKHKWAQKGSQLIPNAIDTIRFKYNADTRQKLRSKYELNDYLVIGHVGRFQPQKNHPKLIEIFEKIHNLSPQSKLILIGDGPDKSAIKQMVCNKGLQEKVLFFGTRNDVEDLYQAMDIFIFPSLFEGLGIVLVEAQCSGLPCVASTQVPRDACVTSNFSFLDLSLPAVKWAEKALANIQRLPDIGQLHVEKNGYDIDKASKMLLNMYLSIVPAE